MNGYIMYLLHKLVSAFMTENSDKSSCYYEETFYVKGNKRLRISFDLKEIQSMNLNEIGFNFTDKRKEGK